MALAALVSGGALFSGYIYLFHLHGVFYGPMLLWTALAVRFCLGPRPSPRGYALVALLALVAAAYHPFTLVLAFALTVAAPFEFGWIRDRRAVAIVAVLAAVGAALIWFVWPKHMTVQTAEKLAALVASARSIEVVRPVALVSLLLAVATAWSTRWPAAWGRRAGTFAPLVVFAMGVGAHLAGAPVLAVWLAAAFVKLVLHRRWSLAAMLAASAALPFAGGSGSPTYAVFALALATVATIVDADGFELALAQVPDAAPAVAAVAILALAGAMRAGVDVPVVSRLARPVIAERERTHQLARLLERILADPAERALPVVLADAARAPVEGATTSDRSHRAPTQQVCLDAYLEHERGAPAGSQALLQIAFGQSDEVARKSGFSEPSTHAGQAVVRHVLFGVAPLH
jgi:hypothetical protein